MAKNPIIEKWQEGPVNPASEHFELRYGPPGFAWDAGLPVARIGRPVRGVVAVAFLVDRAATEHAAAHAAAVGEIQYYLIDKHEPQPWGYAQYHCGTAANAYSDIHWSFYRPQRQTRASLRAGQKGDIVPTRTPSRAVISSIDTTDWAKTMTRVVVRFANKKGARWRVVGFEGPQKRESRGIVDLLVVRKDHTRPPAGLKAGDRLEMVLVQVKGGGAAWPTDEDVDRLRKVAQLHQAKDVLLSVWKKGASPVLHRLRAEKLEGRGQRGWWDGVDAKDVFGRSAAARRATK